MKILTTLLMCSMLATCAYTWKGSIGYVGQYGTYSVGSDGKTIITDIQLKDPKGFAK